jgi:hypothetical protein
LGDPAEVDNFKRFDPARDGFGFRNQLGTVPDRTGGGFLLRRSYAFVYGKGLCFGMAATALRHYSAVGANDSPLAELPRTPSLLAVLQEYQLRQFHPRTMLATVRNWVASGGGRPERVLGRIRLVGTNSDPHILCFGPAPNRRFFSCFSRAHAVVPYRVEGTRVYVYDPNYPRDRGRFVEFRRKGFEFVYGGFRSWEGWGITLVPASACLGGHRHASVLDRVEGTRRTVQQRKRKQVEKMQDDSQSDRREILDRLAGARTASESASARAAADGWLADNPEDDEVRQARERSETAEQEEDLEEGGPT